MGSREQILARIRGALADTDPVPEPLYDYGQIAQVAEVAALFAERVADYRAVVERVPADGIAAAVAAALSGAVRVILPSGLPDEWVAGLDEARTVTDDGSTTADELDRIDAVVTAAAVGIAETGTIVLDHGPGQGRRALTLVPDRHVCVLTEDQVVGDVPEGVARLRRAVDEGRPLTWISGPSATSDIELERVEGVHGPRTLHVLLAPAADR